MSRFVEYAIRRKQGYTVPKAVTLSGDTTLGDRVVGYVTAGILILFAAYATVQYVDDLIDQRDLRVQEQHKQRADKAEALLVAALNGGAILINKTSAVFFDRQTEVKL